MKTCSFLDFWYPFTFSFLRGIAVLYSKEWSRKSKEGVSSYVDKNSTEIAIVLRTVDLIKTQNKGGRIDQIVEEKRFLVSDIDVIGS